MSEEAARNPVEALLAARGSTQLWLAGKLRMDRTLLSRYISGDRPAPSDLYDRIADILHVPVSFLRPEPQPEPDAELVA